MNYTLESKIEVSEIMKLAKSDLLDYWSANNRIPAILLLRMIGEPLSKIGDMFRVNKERIRQQEAKGIELILDHIRFN
jgi:DNA-directed RNA polymerase sigma subunit (sigma70/sigma32)|tara:strand:+ start:1776 stop:2009 length:234 start_codon:yes stop_codon:yes gene_type:complete